MRDPGKTISAVVNVILYLLNIAIVFFFIAVVGTFCIGDKPL